MNNNEKKINDDKERFPEVLMRDNDKCTLLKRTIKNEKTTDDFI